jgi:predicted nucleic acid-binding protein
VTAADTSVAVAAFASWHESHASARAAISGGVALIAHCALETYSVLTRLPTPHRAPGDLVQRFLEAQFSAPHIVMPAREQRRLTARLVELGIEGGAVYDGLVALTAAGAGATLISLDRRAATTYERCSVDVRLVAP